MNLTYNEVYGYIKDNHSELKNEFLILSVLYKNMININETQYNNLKKQQIEYYIIIPKEYKNKKYDMTEYSILRLNSNIVDNYKKIKQWNENELKKYYYDIKNLEMIYTYKKIPEKEGLNKTFDKLSMREFVCILLKIPNSGTLWIDNLINHSNKKL